MKSCHAIPIHGLISCVLIFAGINSCGKKSETSHHRIGGEYLALSGNVTAIAGALDEGLSFVIVPPAGARSLLSRQAFGGYGYLWAGQIRLNNGKTKTFTVKRERSGTKGTVVIADQTFDLADGEIFRMGSDYAVTQISGSKAGTKNDPSNAARILGVVDG